MYQSVSKDVFLTGHIFQVKISSQSGVYVDIGLRGTGHNMRMVLGRTKSVLWESTVTTVPYLVHYDTLLQNSADIITKCDNYFITKCGKSLLQDASGFISQNSTVLFQNTKVISKCDNFIRKCDVYSKILRYEDVFLIFIIWWLPLKTENEGQQNGKKLQV